MRITGHATKLMGRVRKRVALGDRAAGVRLRHRHCSFDKSDRVRVALACHFSSIQTP